MHQPDLPAEPLGGLRAGLLVAWFVSSFGLVYFARDLEFVVLGWPLSFWLSAQGIVLMFVAIVFFYAWVANRAEARQAESAVADSEVLPL